MIIKNRVSRKNAVFYLGRIFIGFFVFLEFRLQRIC